MEHYNMIVSERSLPGLLVIQTESYLRHIRELPGWIHENWGDFYSNFPVKELANRANLSLGRNLKKVMGEKLDKNLVIVDSEEFNYYGEDPEKEYLIKSSDGIRIYTPKLHSQNSRNASLTYGLCGLMFVEELFAEKPQGSLQVQIRKLEEIVKPSLEILANLSKSKKI